MSFNQSTMRCSTHLAANGLHNETSVITSGLKCSRAVNKQHPQNFHSALQGT